MRTTYLKVEIEFEKLTTFATKILGSSISFTIAFCMVLFWWFSNLFTSNDWHQNIGDIIFGTTFLSLFIIQKAFNKHSVLVHLKLNELVLSHQAARNSVMNALQKTESEIVELNKEYLEEEVINVIEKIIEEELIPKVS